MSSSNDRPNDIVIGLKTLDMKSQVARFAPKQVDAPIRPHKKRVFTEDELTFLNSLPTRELYWRIQQGQRLVELLHRPEMMNMTPKKAAMVSSNLKYQMDVIREIISGRSTEVQNG